MPPDRSHRRRPQSPHPNIIPAIPDRRRTPYAYQAVVVPSDTQPIPSTSTPGSVSGIRTSSSPPNDQGADTPPTYEQVLEEIVSESERDHAFEPHPLQSDGETLTPANMGTGTGHGQPLHHEHDSRPSSNSPTPTRDHSSSRRQRTPTPMNRGRREDRPRPQDPGDQPRPQTPYSPQQSRSQRQRRPRSNSSNIPKSLKTYLDIAFPKPGGILRRRTNEDGETIARKIFQELVLLDEDERVALRNEVKKRVGRSADDRDTAGGRGAWRRS